MNPDEFKVSVVIPVYQAEKYIARAVERVLMQPEVTELILMEDGSPDRSLEVCRELQTQSSIISVYRHDGGVNKGAAATRNAGVKYASNEFIAFADADNLYLPERFKLDKELFASDPSIDGIYNAQGVHYETESSRQGFFKAGLGSAEFLSVSEEVPPEEFLSVLLGRHPTAKVLGGLGIDAITLRKRCFKKAGFFTDQLRLQQDVHFYFKLAAVCNMHAGNIREPVALRGVHDEMRSTDSKLMDECRRMRWQLLEEWFSKNVVDADKCRMFKRAFSGFKIRNSGKASANWELLKSVFTDPGSIFTAYGRFDLNYLYLYKNSRLAVKALSGKNRIIRLFNK